MGDAAPWGSARRGGAARTSGIAAVTAGAAAGLPDDERAGAARLVDARVTSVRATPTRGVSGCALSGWASSSCAEAIGGFRARLSAPKVALTSRSAVKVGVGQRRSDGGARLAFKVTPSPRSAVETPFFAGDRRSTRRVSS